MSKRKHTVEEFMSTALITMRAADPVTDAVREMRLASIRHVPVVDAGGRVVGVLSSHDVVAALAAGGSPTVGEVMTASPFTVRPGEPAEHAVGEMIDRKIDCLPVVGEGGELVGIVTATDFLVVAHQALTRTPLGREADEV